MSHFVFVLLSLSLLDIVLPVITGKPMTTRERETTQANL